MNNINLLNYKYKVFASKILRVLVTFKPLMQAINQKVDPCIVSDDK